jgi:hypothetical protein
MGALAPGLFLTIFYFLFPGWLVKIIFTDAYANPGTHQALPFSRRALAS